MNADISYQFFDYQIGHISPHRHPMLMVDKVEACAADLSQVEALKLLSVSEPMLCFPADSRPYFSPTLLTEALAQTCGFLMN